MNKKIDFTSSNFKFISKPNKYYMEGIVDCESDFSEWIPTYRIKNGWGMFRGLTMVTYKGYTGELPRKDGDTCSFKEFNIYYKDIRINDMTYEDLYTYIISRNREDKLNIIINDN